MKRSTFLKTLAKLVAAMAVVPVAISHAMGGRKRIPVISIDKNGNIEKTEHLTKKEYLKKYAITTDDAFNVNPVDTYPDSGWIKPKGDGTVEIFKSDEEVFISFSDK